MFPGDLGLPWAVPTSTVGGDNSYPEAGSMAQQQPVIAAMMTAHMSKPDLIGHSRILKSHNQRRRTPETQMLCYNISSGPSVKPIGSTAIKSRDYASMTDWSSSLPRTAGLAAGRCW